MSKEITIEDLNFILESLGYTKLRFEEYKKYPNDEYKQKRIDYVIKLIAKVQALKKDLKKL